MLISLQDLKRVALSLAVLQLIQWGLALHLLEKKGNYPREVIRYEYDLEYGTNVLTMHKDAIKPGQRVLITDDLLATGGTIEAAIKLVEKLGGIVVGIAFIIELKYLNGIEKLKITML